jgi:hypothetical protein
MATIWQELLIVFGGNAMLLAACAYLIKTLITQRLTKEIKTFEIELNAKADISIEQLKHTLEMSAVEHQVQFEAKISNQKWKFEQKSQLQLNAIQAFSLAASEYISNVVADPNYRPTFEWFASFDASGALIKALFDDEAYVSYDKFQKRIGSGLHEFEGKTSAEMRHYAARDGAVKAMLNSVIGELT